MLIVQISFAEKKIKAEGSVTFQNIFSSSSGFRDVVSVLPAVLLIRASKILVAVQKANRPWEIRESFLALIVIVVEPAIKKRLLVNWLASKKGAIFSLIYFFKSFCIYYIPPNYVIPQAMPHAIPQAHSPFYPHRFSIGQWSESCESPTLMSFASLVLNNIFKKPFNLDKIMQILTSNNPLLLRVFI